MKRFACLFFIVFVLTKVVFAEDNTRSAVVVNGTPLSVTVPDKRTMRIINFVQETGAIMPATVSVMKDSSSATILQASDVGAKMSAEDKNMQVNGLATVTVTNPDTTRKAFITYRIVNE